MVGIYFLILAVLYVAYRYVLSEAISPILNSLDNQGNYDTQNYENYMIWVRYLGFGMAAWIFVAWGIAIWYNIKIVFNRQAKIKETEHV